MSTKKVKVTQANDLIGFLEESTGRYIKDLLDISKNYRVEKLDLVENILYTAVKDNRFVTVVGDYDCDGICSCAIMIMILREIENRFKIRIPKRESEGYGFSLPISTNIPDNTLVVCIDNGIMAHEAIKEVKKRGCDVIVLDHHQKGDTLPEADVIIDPEAVGGADFVHYCGAGLAYKLAAYMFGENSDVTKKALPFAAIATIGDVVSMTGDNRKIVKAGLEAIKNGAGTVGLQTLCRISGINEVSTATDIAFSVVPTLNAPSRLEDNGAVLALSTIILDTGFDELLSNLIAKNKLRKDLTRAITESIDMESLRDNNKKVVVLHYEKMIPGLAGIIAGKVAEETRKPTAVFTGSGELKGSVRNPVEEVNVFEVLRNTGLLIQGGGHPKAAGISVKQEDLSLFTETFDKLVGEIVPVIDTEKVIGFNLEVKGADLPALATEIFSLEPYGEGFPEPILRVTDEVVSVKKMGSEGQHLRILCKNNFTIVAFNTTMEDGDVGKKVVRAIGKVQQNYFNGNVSLQFKADDIEFI